MKAMLKKDLLCCISNYKTVLLIGLMFSVVGVMSGNSFFIAGFVMIYALLLPMTSFSIDEHCKWHTYGLAMPVTRKEMVQAKYILAFVITLCASAFAAVTIAAAFFVGKGNFDELLGSLAGSAVGMIILVSVMIPFMYKFGIEKARLVIVSVAIVPYLLILAADYMEWKMPDEKTIEMVLMSMPLIAVVMFILSYLLSVRIFEKKEF